MSLTASVTLTASTVTFFSLAGAGNSLTLTCSAAVTVNGAIYLGILNLLSNGVGTTNLTGSHLDQRNPDLQRRGEC